MITACYPTGQKCIDTEIFWFHYMANKKDHLSSHILFTLLRPCLENARLFAESVLLSGIFKIGSYNAFGLFPSSSFYYC